MITRRRFLWQIVGLTGIAVASLATACAPSAQPAAPVKTEAKPSEAPKPTAAAAPAKPTEAPKPAPQPTAAPKAEAKPATAPAAVAKTGGRLVVAIEGDPNNFDPAFFSVPGRRVTRTIYDPLLELDEQGNMQPGLIERWERTSDTTWVFHVRPGVKFHDGTPLDAEAVKFHFDRHMDPATASLRKSEFGPFDRAEIVDGMTVRIVMKEPYAPFPYALFDWAGFVISPTAYKQWGKDEYRFHPVGTGPFKFVSYAKDQQTVVERNPDYWRPGEPLLESITFRAIPLNATRLTELRSGGVHIAEDLPFQDIQRLKAMSDIVVSEKDGFRWDAFMFHYRKEPGSNKNLRQALNWALDREAIHSTVYFGTGSIGYDTFLPGTVYHDPNYKPFTRDVDRAKRLIDQAGLPSGLQLQGLIYQDQPYEKALQIVQANFAELGITLNLTVRDLASVTDSFQKGEYDFSVNWWGFRPDPDAWISPKFHSKGTQNYYAFYNSPEADAIIERARQVSDPAERVRLYRQLAVQMNEDAPHIFFHYGANIKGLSPKVKGFTHFLDSMIRYQRVSVDG